MSEQENMRVVQVLYDNFNAGNIAAVVEGLSENVAWVLPSIPNIAFSGAKHGKDGVADFFSTMPISRNHRALRCRELSRRATKWWHMGIMSGT